MKTVTYLCECGKSNVITTKKRTKFHTPLFFFCGGCGKPSYDRCVKCDHHTLIEYQNKFCQQCGAGPEEIQKGVKCVDLWGTFKEVVQALIFGSALLYVLLRYLDEPMQKWQLEQMKNHSLEPLGLWFFGVFIYLALGREILAIFIAPIETLVTGRKTPSLNARVVARWIYWNGQPTALGEQRLIEEALKTRTRVKWLVRKLRIVHQRIHQSVNK